MTAVAVQQYRPAMDSCKVGTRLYRTCALTAPDSSDPGEWIMVGVQQVLTVIRMLNVDRKYRKCEGKYERVIIKFRCSKCFGAIENGDGNLMAVAYASERYDV